MPLLKIVGDVLEAFAITIDLPVDLDTVDLDTDEAARAAIATEIGIPRYLRERDFRIDYVVEVDPLTGEELEYRQEAALAAVVGAAGATATYAIVTPNGTRRWTADDETHAREQHLDMFAAGADPGEVILGVCRLTLPDASDDTASRNYAPSAAYISAARKAARRLYFNDDLDMDDDAKVSEGDDGAFVAMWRWVTKAEMGLCPDCGRTATECPVKAAPGDVEGETVADCIAGATHLLCCAPDGFCNVCYDYPIPQPTTSA